MLGYSLLNVILKYESDRPISRCSFLEKNVGCVQPKTLIFLHVLFLEIFQNLMQITPEEKFLMASILQNSVGNNIQVQKIGSWVIWVTYLAKKWVLKKFLILPLNEGSFETLNIHQILSKQLESFKITHKGLEELAYCLGTETSTIPNFSRLSGLFDHFSAQKSIKFANFGPWGNWRKILQNVVC